MLILNLVRFGIGEILCSLRFVIGALGEERFWVLWEIGDFYWSEIWDFTFSSIKVMEGLVTII